MVIHGNLDLNYGYKDFVVGNADIKPSPNPVLPLNEIVKEVIQGKWGNGEERKNRLENAGYNYDQVQEAVNRELGIQNSTNEEIAKEVIQGKWGNGEERKNRLENAGYNYDVIQNLVNEMMGQNTYIVKKGDTLSEIGEKVGVNWQKIASLNGISGPNYIIYPGQVLKLS